MGYLAEQGVGQISLLTSARDNKWVINDPETPAEVREKILYIQELKRYFQEYWDVSTGRIYTRTTFLDHPAVTYLLIASPHDKIEPHTECFPVMGCFPYLGFFHPKSARSWAKNLEREGLVTYVRPVYAYSTLGYFSDTILSSFFVFDKFDLTELIFHELFHTMFFPPNEVALNEALATYFAREMTYEYFGEDSDLTTLRKQNRVFSAKLSAEWTKYVRKLSQKYSKERKKQQRDLKPHESKEILNNFLDNRVRPHFENFCGDIGLSLSSCFPLNRRWDNAQMAAFMTYQDQMGPIEKLRDDLDVDIRGLFRHIEARYDDYRDLPRSKRRGANRVNFSDFLFESKTKNEE